MVSFSFMIENKYNSLFFRKNNLRIMGLRKSIFNFQKINVCESKLNYLKYLNKIEN